jgi:hypothetical protein
MASGGADGDDRDDAVLCAWRGRWEMNEPKSSKATFSYDAILSSENTEDIRLHDIRFYNGANIQKTVSVLHITPAYSVEFAYPKPNRWHRFWQRIFLGWTWSDAP